MRLFVTAEASTGAAIAGAIAAGADGVRVDLDAVAARGPVLEALQACLLTADAVARHGHLEALTAQTARAFAPLARAAAGVELSVLVGNRPPRCWFPHRPEDAVAMAARRGEAPARLWARLEHLGIGIGRLGLRGARWVLEDAEVHRAMVQGVLEAAVGLADAVWIVVPGVGFAGEAAALAAAMAVDADGAPALRLVASLESARGLLEAERIAAAGRLELLEVDLLGLTETTFALAHADARAVVPRMIEQGALEADPFARLDDVIGELIARVSGAPLALRGRQALGEQGLVWMARAGASRVVVPAECVAEARGAELAAGPGRARARVESLPAPVGRGEAAGVVPAGVRAQDFLDQVVADVERGARTRAEALLAIPPTVADALARPSIDARGVEPLCAGIAGAPGCGVGRIALSTDRVVEYREAGAPCVLVVHEVYGEAAGAVRAARALISARGGRTSHAALVAANSGVPCVLDERLRIDLEAGRITLGGRTFEEGDWLSVDGSTGTVYAGALPLVTPATGGSLATILGWADDVRRLRVAANADRPEDARIALDAGADAVGLVRTENMLLEPDRLAALRALLVGDPAAAEAAAARLCELMRADFAAWFEAVGTRPVSFRLLDAPVSEFLPLDRRQAEALAAAVGLTVAETARRIDGERPHDAATALRALRLSIVRPDLERAQVTALARAYAAARAAGRAPAALRIIAPLVSGGAEMAATARRVRALVEAAAPGTTLELGAMIEMPRAALDAERVAEHVSFFAWGSNDLTQFVLGISRELAPRLIERLRAAGAIAVDPTETLDVDGVGRLIAAGEARGKRARPDLVTGVCGRLGSEPRAIAIFHQLKMDYVSVPPAQVARARIAAAQAALVS